MAEEPKSTSNKHSARKTTERSSTTALRQSSLLEKSGHLLALFWAISAATVCASNSGLTQWLESKTQTSFFQMRGVVAPPENIVILAIDEQSLSLPKQYYQSNPQKYADLEPLQSTPYKRAAYAKVIEQLMKAGAKGVALDILFDQPSTYGVADDQQLKSALQHYAGRVTLAAEIYEDVSLPQGALVQLNQPIPELWSEPRSFGLTRFPLDPDGKIHRLGSEYPKILAEKYEGKNANSEVFSTGILSFAEAALQAAGVKYPRVGGNQINYFGPGGTFDAIPFWYVLDPESWNSNLQGGKVFQNKIVLIGGTAALQHDFHGTPFADSWLYPQPMSGIEVHANALATLMTGRAIKSAIPLAPVRGLFVLGLVGITFMGVVKSSKRGLSRFGWAIAAATAWCTVSYVGFVYGQLILPTAVPMIALALGGLSYLGTGAARESLRKNQLIGIFKKYASSPIIQEIVSQQEDLQEIIKERDLAATGKILVGRYQIVKVLGSGGFSETYVAEDTQLPGAPLCVVKQLRPASNKPKQLEIARRLFKLEAQMLQLLGKNSQIPQLLAYFEQHEEFYLVQELIVGHPLNRELPTGRPISEAKVIEILQDLLPTLAFVHRHGVIHRDIKPSNIIRRYSDDKLVLIDFGAVKEVTTQVLQEGQTSYTIGIGTQGYAPNEQSNGRPQYCSDIYAVGMIGIKALTGKSPHELEFDAQGELKWQHLANTSSPIAAILSKMVLYDFNARYQSVTEVLLALEQIVPINEDLYLDNESTESLFAEDSDTPTIPWNSESPDTN